MEMLSERVKTRRIHGIKLRAVISHRGIMQQASA